MADLRRRDRGQIILIAAFALAVIFLTLALVVNSAIFTENLASRSDTTGSDDALTNRAVVEQNVGEAMASANRNNPGSLRTSLEDTIQSFNSNFSRQQAMSGIVTDVTYDTSAPSDTTEGTRIDYDGGNFDTGGNLVTDVDRVPDGNGTRAFVINASSLPGSSNKFTVRVDATETWETEIWDGGSTVEVRTTRSGLSEVESCSISRGSSSAPTIDLTGGTINGVPCKALGTNDTGYDYHFGAGVSDPYDIEFVNGDDISGDFTVVINSGTVNAPTDGTANVDNALYDVTVEYSYTTNDVRYVTDIRVAPGEPDA